MALEDFFTLTEIKDGLTASVRVEELVNVMLKERDYAGDTTRPWSTVASTIAATEDKDCLDLFVQLDGIAFINKWLEDAQKLGNEPSDNSEQESITVLLQAVEKLDISYEQSVANGIRETVKKLLTHCCVRVKERARALFDCWKQQGAEVVTGKVDDIAIQPQNEEKKPFEDSLCNKGEDLPCCLDGSAPNSISTATVSKEDVLASNQFGCSKKQMQEVASPSNKLGAMAISHFPTEKASEPLTGSDLQTPTNIEVSNNSKELAADDMRRDMSLSLKDKSAIDGAPPIHNETMEVYQDEGQDCDNNVLEGSGNVDNWPKLHYISGDEDKLRKLQFEDTSSSGGNSGSIIGEHSSVEKGLTSYTDLFKTKRKVNDVINKSRSDFELNYGTVDSLEVAPQVAIEVEREVKGQRETSCSSSHKVPEAETSKPESSTSMHGNETVTDKSASKEGSPEEGELSDDQKDLTAISSRVPDGVQDPESKSDKGIVDLDLNQEIFTDDTDCRLDTISTTVSIVSACRAAAAPGFPASPLQFEGAHGWKGSAATSAFRATSLHKVHDSDKIDNNSKRHRNFLDFNLNMPEDADGKTTDLVHGKQNLHSGESSEESRLNLDLNRISDEADAPPPDWRISERLLLSRNGHYNASSSSSSSSMQQPLRNFDLNDQPSFFNDSSEINFFTKSPSSQKLRSSLGPISSDSEISIMGAKVGVNQKDLFLHSPSSANGRILSPNLDINLGRNGGVMEIGTAVPYPHPSMYTYNGLTTALTGTFSPVMYVPSGPIPYTVDSRGAPVVTLLLGSVSSAPAPYAQPPFVSASTFGKHSPGLNGHGPSLPSCDLNLGLMGERVNQESGGLSLFLGPSQNRSLDELRSNFQPSSSLGVGKRKEPDGGWEPYQFV